MMNQQTSKQHLEIVIPFVAHHQKREISYVHNQNSKNASKWALAVGIGQCEEIIPSTNQKM